MHQQAEALITDITDNYDYTPEAEEQPVYGDLVPVLRRAIASPMLRHAEDEPDEDAAEVRAVLSATLEFLRTRDTTVRETY